MQPKYDRQRMCDTALRLSPDVDRSALPWYSLALTEDDMLRRPLALAVLELLKDRCFDGISRLQAVTERPLDYLARNYSSEQLRRAEAALQAGQWVFFS